MPKRPHGYLTRYGFKGWVEKLNRYILFATEKEYYEYLEEEDNG